MFIWPYARELFTKLFLKDATFLHIAAVLIPEYPAQCETWWNYFWRSITNAIYIHMQLQEIFM